MENVKRIINDTAKRFANGTGIQEILELDIKQMPDLVAAVLVQLNKLEKFMLRGKIYNALTTLKGKKKKGAE